MNTSTKLLPIYLCGGINKRTDAEAKDWRELAKSLSPWPTLDPMRRDYRGRELKHVNEIVTGDLKDITDSWALIVYYDKPSVGTSMEMFNAYWNGKPVVLINASGDVSLSPWLIYHAHYMVSTVEEAISRLTMIARERPGIDAVPPARPDADVVKQLPPKVAPTKAKKS